jgi:hypothetical protein
MAAKGNSCFWLANVKKISPRKLLGQMEPNLAGSDFLQNFRVVRSSCADHFYPCLISDIINGFWVVTKIVQFYHVLFLVTAAIAACQDLHALQLLSKSDYPSRSYCPFLFLFFLI